MADNEINNILDTKGAFIGSQMTNYSNRNDALGSIPRTNEETNVNTADLYSEE